MKFVELGPFEETSYRLNVESKCREQIVQMLCEVLVDTMKVFDFGAKKHPDSGDTPNFLLPNGNKCSRHERGSSVLRHAARTFMHPELLDEESQVSELLHLIASAAILYIRHKRNIKHPIDCKHQILQDTIKCLECGKVDHELDLE